MPNGAEKDIPNNSTKNILPFEMNLLVVIIDLNCENEIVPELTLFLHMYLSLGSTQVLVIGSGVTNTIVYPSRTIQGNVLKQFHDIDKDMNRLIGLESCSSPKIAGALSLGLAYQNKITNASGLRLQNTSCRFLVLSHSPDDPSQHIAIMNSMFAAQRSHIPIDIIRLSDKPCVFLKQACFITNGNFEIVKSNLIHHLMFSFLTDPHIRKEFVTTKQQSLDFTCVCFCHKRNVDLAFVCSVCLSSIVDLTLVFCKLEQKCPTCLSDL